MTDAPRRFFLLIAAFALAGGGLFFVFRGDSDYGLFDLLRGRKAPRAKPGTHKVEDFTLPQGARLDPEDVPGLNRLNEEVAAVTSKVLPSVVSIAAAVDGAEGDPGEGKPKRVARPRLGAGVIVTEEGHVITNYHVVHGVSGVLVRLANDRLLPAEIVGASPRVDIAVLKIVTPKDETFPALPFIEDSDAVRAGEFVISVGKR